FMGIRRVVEEREQAENMIPTLALTIEARDTYTAGHCVRLASYAVELGERLGLGHEELSALRLGGFLHDLGKIRVPDGVLLKPGPLTPDEWRMIREHPDAGDPLATPMRTPSLVRPLLRHHHGRSDGPGYPDQLVGEERAHRARVT